jgi:hypothetical protein
MNKKFEDAFEIYKMIKFDKEERSLSINGEKSKIS